MKAITILTKIKKSYLKILLQAFSMKIKDSSLNVGNTPSTAQKHSQVLEKYLITEYRITDVTWMIKSLSLFNNLNNDKKTYITMPIEKFIS